jgi:hypothetical protein
MRSRRPFGRRCATLYIHGTESPVTDFRWSIEMGNSTQQSPLGVTRRTLLSGTAALFAGAAVSSASESPDASRIDADVLVVGGGTAGTIAAIQSARLHAKTVLVEQGSQLGGTMTTGGVNFPGLFCAWGRQIIAGIGWDLVKATVELQGGTLPDFSKSVWPALEKHPQFQVRLSGGLYAAIAEEACVKAGVELRYYEFPLLIRRVPDGWLLEVVGKGTRTEVHCRQLIDCTGNASVAGLAGLARQREAETQPGSICFALDPMGQAKNQLYVFGADSSTSETHTAANIAGRRAVLEYFRALKGRSETRDVKLVDLRPETAVRETYRIVGEMTVTREDFESGRKYADAVAFAYYPIDLHTRDGVRPRHLKEGTVPTIPLSALVPKASSNLLVAGRCISSDRLANSALRVQASCMAMGQAAGAAAALAARSGITPLAVPLEDLRAVLREHGAIVPDGT